MKEERGAGENDLGYDVQIESTKLKDEMDGVGSGQDNPSLHDTCQVYF